MDSRDSLNHTVDSIDLTECTVKYKNTQRDTEKSNKDTSDNDIDEMIQFNTDKARKIYRKDINEQRKRIKIVKSNKGRTTRVYVREKRLLKQRREKALQNAKDRKIGKANAQIALQASTRANRASKDTQDIKMTDNAATGENSTDNATTGENSTDNAATGEDSTVDVHLPPCSSGKAKHPSQIKTSLKHTTAIAEHSTGDPLLDGQATVKVSGHTSDLSDIGIYEFLIQGAPNPHDVEGVEEEQ